MKVLLAHDHYRSSAPSGEDAVYKNEKALLEEKGIHVIAYEKFNDNIDESTFQKKVKLTLDGAWSRETYYEMTSFIRTFKPGIAHFHNTFPLISPSAYVACQDNGVPVVQTLHNFRFICPGAMLLRNGQPCEKCIDKNLLSALWHKCYRDSLSATAAQVWTILRNRMSGNYTNNVNRYIALTSFAAEKLVSGGLPKEKMEIKPNFLPVNAKLPSSKKMGGYAVYTGRLSKEKGIGTLLRACKQCPDLKLKVLGDGPMRVECETYVRENKLRVEFLGYQSKQNVLEIVSNADFQVVPSEWYEGFPMVLLEALSCGTPVVASRIGSLSEIIQDGESGFKFEAGNVADLSDKIKQISNSPDKLAEMCKASQKIFNTRYSSDKNYETLLEIYDKAIKDKNKME